MSHEEKTAATATKMALAPQRAEPWQDEGGKGSSDRTFGLLFVAVFGWIGWSPVLHHREIRQWAAGISAVLLVVSLAAPKILHPANQAWSKLSLLLNQVFSPLAMGVIFFGIATPMAFMMRLWGKDPLRLGFDPSAKTYWQERSPPGPAPSSMRNQF